MAVEHDAQVIVDGEIAALEGECCAGGGAADAETDGEEAQGFFDDGFGVREGLELFGGGEERGDGEGVGLQEGGVFFAEGFDDVGVFREEHVYELGC